jgi:hypothetical protein
MRHQTFLQSLLVSARLYWRFCRNIVAADHRSAATILRQNLQYKLVENDTISLTQVGNKTDLEKERVVYYEEGESLASRKEVVL